MSSSNPLRDRLTSKAKKIDTPPAKPVADKKAKTKPQSKGKKTPAKKAQLHPRNKHQGKYDLQKLVESLPDLKAFVFVNEYGTETVDFAKPEAVKVLNRALLKHHYGVKQWHIPDGYLCPPIPGRADYIHYAADLLAADNRGQVPTGKDVRCVDIGVGSNCIYPILGNREYGWSFVGSEIDETAFAAAYKNVQINPNLKGKIKLKQQHNPKDTLHGIIGKNDEFDLVLCNPPFHGSAKEAEAASMRKQRNLKKGKVAKPVLNFGGKSNELWSDGGEKEFVKGLIKQSWHFYEQVNWFTTLVSKEANLKSVEQALHNVKAKRVKIVPMGQGNKKTRMVAWSWKENK